MVDNYCKMLTNVEKIKHCRSPISLNFLIASNRYSKKPYKKSNKL